MNPLQSTIKRHIVGILIVAILASLFIFSSLIYVNNTKSIPSQGGEYREGVIGLPKLINPVLSATNDVDKDLTRLIYNSLLTYDKEGNLITDLAKSYQISNDQKTYTFTLRDNLLWEDGKPITADDIVFTIKTIQDQRYISPLLPIWNNVEVLATSKNIVVFNLSTPYTAFIENFTTPILPKHIWQSIEHQNFHLSEFNIKPIGSGAFKVNKITENIDGVIVSYKLERNDNYHGKKPYLDFVSLYFYNTEEDAIDAYNSRILDGISYLSPINKDKIKAKAYTNLHEIEMPRYFALFFNRTNNKTLKDQRVRKALIHATDKDKIVEKILFGYADIINSPIPPVNKIYYNENISTLKYDQKQSGELLEEAGWQKNDKNSIREKEGKKLELTIVSPKNQEIIQVLEEIKKQWKEIGVNVTILPKNTEEITQNFIRTRKYDILMYGESLQIIPDPYPFWHSSQKDYPGLNFSMIQNDQIDTLLEKARFEINENKRIEYYKELQELIINDSTALFLHNTKYLHIIKKTVKGVTSKTVPDPSWRFIGIKNWHKKTKRVF